MKIAITSQGRTLDANLDPRFGRAAYILFVDPETEGFTVEKNSALTTPSGAGIEAAQHVVDRGVEAVISGRFGPKAYQALEAAGLTMYTASSGSVRKILEVYRAGDLTTAAPARGGRRGRRGR